MQKLLNEAEGAFDCHTSSLVKQYEKQYLEDNKRVKLFKNPLHLARGPLGLWYCKVDSLNQTLMNSLKIVLRADEPKMLQTDLPAPALPRRKARPICKKIRLSAIRTKV